MRNKEKRLAAQPIARARGRGLTEKTNMARQTDSLAYSVELLQLLLAEQRRTNEWLAHIASKWNA